MPMEFYQGRPLKPEELQAIRQQIERFDTIEAIDPEMRGIVERNWPHLIAKLPRRTADASDLGSAHGQKVWESARRPQVPHFANGFPPLVLHGPRRCAFVSTELAFEHAKAKAVSYEGEGQIGKADSCPRGKAARGASSPL
jgi:hypothetical protein